MDMDLEILELSTKYFLADRLGEFVALVSEHFGGKYVQIAPEGDIWLTDVDTRGDYRMDSCVEPGRWVTRDEQPGLLAFLQSRTDF